MPIQGRYSGTVQLIPLSTTMPEFRVNYFAEGNVSHLGRVEAILSTPRVQLDLAGRRLIVPTNTWFGTITAANGDQIAGAYVIPEVVDITPTGHFSFEADLEIREGTGRFKDATGWAGASVSGNVFAGTFEVEMEGWISTVGRSKK